MITSTLSTWQRGVRPRRSCFVWTNAQGATTIAGQVATKGPGDAWDSGAQASTRLTGAGFAEWIVTDATSLQMVGLSTTAAPAAGDFTAIEWAMYVGPGAIWESGAPTAGVFGPPSVGDRLRVGVEAGAVVYRYNDTAVYTSLVAPSGRLFAVVSQFSGGASVKGATLQGVWTP